MAGKISRRKLAEHTAKRLANGDPTNGVMRELAAYLIESRREKEAELIVRDVENALLAKGTAVATVVSARKLADDAKKALREFISSQYSGVKTVELREKVDSSLIGGVRLELPDRQLDASVKSKLEKLVV